MSSKTPIQIAVLDDYQRVSTPLFSSLPSSTFQTTIFTDTLPSYAHSTTTQHAKTQLVARLKPFTIICSMRERTAFPAELLSELPNLKVLLTTGGRNASIDTEACKKLGIQVAGTIGNGRSTAAKTKKARGPDSTTQHCVALILGIARNIAQDDLVVKSGGWQTSLATGLSGKIFATAGLGRLGVNVAKIMHQSFGMKVIAWSSSLTQEAADEKARSVGLPTEDEEKQKIFEVVSKEDLFRRADVLSVHYVLSTRSRGIIGKEELALMKKEALLVNTSRGPLVDEKALLRVLKRGAIRGAAIDVFEFEPLPGHSEWRSSKWGTEGTSHVLLTPHMGYVEEETLRNWYEENIENIERWHSGQELLTPLASYKS